MDIWDPMHDSSINETPEYSPSSPTPAPGAERPAQTDDLKSGFHWRDGWYFKRLENGTVRIVFIAGEWLYTHLLISADEWASIMCSVSVGGETATRYQQARDFHNLREALAAAPPAPTNNSFDLGAAVKNLHALQRVGEAMGLHVPPTDVESLAATFHDIYQQEAKRQGDVRHKDSYVDLPDNVKEFDRVLARYVLANFGDRHASAERVRELEQAIKAINEEYLAYLHGPERYPTLGLINAIGCAESLARRALPPSTGEKVSK